METRGFDWDERADVPEDDVYGYGGYIPEGESSRYDADLSGLDKMAYPEWDDPSWDGSPMPGAHAGRPRAGADASPGRTEVMTPISAGTRPAAGPSPRRPSAEAGDMPRPSRPQAAGRRAAGTRPRKRRHPIRTAFLALLIAAIAFAGANVAMDNMKGDEQLAADFAGTWKVKAVGSPAHPVISTLGSLVATSGTGAADSIELGIYDGKAQMELFGLVQDGSFEVDGHHFVFEGDSGARLEGDVRFGRWLVATDSLGNLDVFEKSSQSYEPKDASSTSLDAGEILDRAKELSDLAGGAGAEYLSGIDRQAFDDLVSNADPEKLDEALGAVDMDALARGDIEGAVNLEDPRIKALVEEYGQQPAEGE